MDVKTFMASPAQALADLGLLAGDVSAQTLMGLHETIGECKRAIKTIKKDKADIARQFKATTPDTEEHSQLIAAMQAVSEQLKRVEEQHKSAEKSLSALLVKLQKSDSAEDSFEIAPPFIYITPGQVYDGNYSVRELAESEQGLWQAFLLREKTSAYHQPAWAEVMQNSFARPTRIWVAVSSAGDILGGVPLAFFDSKLFGRFAVSIPYFNYGGVISPWFNVARDLVESLRNVCVSENLSHIEVRTMQADLGAEASTKKASMVLKLPATEAALDEQLGAKVRAQIKKAEEHQPSVRFGKMELLDDFYRVFAQNMRDLGTPVYSRQWFANILQHRDITAQLIVVYVAGNAVSAGFVVGYRGMLEIPWASTIKKANALNTNMWMYRQILGYAVREGYEFFDFGRSTQDAGTYKFKKQWGAQPYTHYWYTLVPPGSQPPELNPDNPKFKLMIAVWQRLPVWVTRIIGPPIVANIP